MTSKFGRWTRRQTRTGPVRRLAAAQQPGCPGHLAGAQRPPYPHQHGDRRRDLALLHHTDAGRAVPRHLDRQSRCLEELRERFTGGGPSQFEPICGSPCPLSDPYPPKQSAVAIGARFLLGSQTAALPGILTKEGDALLHRRGIVAQKFPDDRATTVSVSQVFRFGSPEHGGRLKPCGAPTDRTTKDRE